MKRPAILSIIWIIEHHRCFSFVIAKRFTNGLLVRECLLLKLSQKAFSNLIPNDCVESKTLFSEGSQAKNMDTAGFPHLKAVSGNEAAKHKIELLGAGIRSLLEADCRQ